MGTLDVAPHGRSTRQVGRPEGGAHRSSAAPLGWDHCQGLHEGRLVFHHRFSGRIWGIDCWRIRWMSYGRCGGYGFGISLAGHGLKMVGCCWDQWRFWGIDGNKVEGFRFSKERKRDARIPFSLPERRRPSQNWALGGSRRPCTEAWPHWGRPMLGRPCWSAHHSWAPVGPSLCWSAGRVE